MSTHTSNLTDNGLSISELIRRVHNELSDSQRRREMEGSPPLFEVESLTIEAQFVISSTAEGKGGFDLKIVSLGTSASTKSEQIHKIILKLKTVPDSPYLGLTEPEMADGKRPRPVEDDSFNF